MAYWIIIDNYTTKVYKCSECGSEWHDCIYSPDQWKNCPACKAVIKTGEISLEATPVEPGPMRDVLILSIEKYDEMKTEIERLKNRSVELERNYCYAMDILQKIGITEEYLDKMISSSLGVGMDENPITREKRVAIQFRLREV